MPSQHALLGPSSAHQWLVCTPSARAQENIPDKPSDAASEGTLAHSMVELGIDCYLNGRDYDKEVKQFSERKFYSQSMIDYAREFVDYVVDYYQGALKEDRTAKLFSEVQLDLRSWVPSAFGTSDVIIISGDELIIMDFKYGKGVPVSATKNPQMMLYALGAYDEYDMFYGFKRVSMIIYQPRISNLNGYSLSVEELLDWGESYVRPRAEMAWNGEGEFVPGEHQCRFCRYAPQCRALADRELELFKFELRKGPALEPEEIGMILSRVDELTKWASAVRDYAQDQCVNKGMKLPGWKVVEGRSNRVLTAKTDNVISALSPLGITEIWKPQEMKSLSQLEETFGKKRIDKALEKYITKPKGKPVLVPETDSRPSIFVDAADEF